jgi:SP family facilitated glucose transporter-like MFS transporter 3
MSLSTAVLGWAINTDHFLVASAFIMLFVVGFSTGLGPIPFVLVGEMPLPEVRPALSLYKRDDAARC